VVGHGKKNIRLHFDGDRGHGPDPGILLKDSSFTIAISIDSEE